jgi:hypothetical protein
MKESVMPPKEKGMEEIGRSRISLLTVISGIFEFGA